MAGDTFIRGGRVDATTLSANMVGSLLGSTAGEQALKSMEKQPKHQPSPKPAGKGSRHDLHQPAPTHATRKAPVRASRSDGHLLADEYDRQRAFGVARNRAAFWNSRNTPSAAQPTAADRLESMVQSNAANDDYATRFTQMSVIEKATMITLGGAAALALLPEALIGLVGSMATATIAGPVVEIMLADGMIGPVIGEVASAGLGAGYPALKAGLFGAESVMQSATKHPLAGLSSGNIVRLVDELGLETPKDQLILWSGLGRGNAGIKLSQEFARANGGVTLEMTPGGQWLHEMDLFNMNSSFTYKEAVKIWESVSSKMIQQASGQVRSLVGQVRPTSIYRAEQSEILINNKILGLDELNLKPRYIFGK